MSTHSFADLLRQFRTRAGFSQEFLADKSSLSVQAIGALERGTRRAPHRKTVALLADALKLDAGQRAQLEDAAGSARARSAAVADVPAPKAPGRDLPLQPTSFVGRTRDVAMVGDLLRTSRLVTLTGTGGVGKTRTAIEVARCLPDSMWEKIHFVDLSALSDGALIVGAIASAMNLPCSAAEGTIDDLVGLLRSRRVLLILDNCEHIISDAVGVVGPILQQCQDVTVLATSRERLAVSGESVYRLAPLELPPPSITSIAQARAFTGVELFFQRVQASDRTFHFSDAGITSVVAICRQLDGIPLALELAAARAPTLGLVELSKRLRNGFALTVAGRNLPARQQTMLATIAWSYGLLGESEQLVLQRLSLFAGGFTLSAAEGVCSCEEVAAESVAGILASLVDKSIAIVAVTDHIARYGLLESVRSFALDRLIDRGQKDDYARRHAQWVATFADWFDETRATMPPPRIRSEVDPELENARTALMWTLETPSAESAVLAGRIVGGLRTIWLTSGRRNECKRWALAAYDRIDQEEHPHIVAQLLRALIQASTGSEMLHFAASAMPVFERIGDIAGRALLHAHIASRYRSSGLLQEADANITRAGELFSLDTSPRLMPYAAFLQNRCEIRLDQGRLDEALADINEGAAIAKALGDHDALNWECARANQKLAAGDPQAARRLAEESLERGLASPSVYKVDIIELYLVLALSRLIEGDRDGACAAGREALRSSVSRNFDEYAAASMITIALMAADASDAPLAARLLGAVEAVHGRWNDDPLFAGGGAERRARQMLLASIKGQLSPDELEAQRSEGALMSAEVVISEALRI